MQTQDFIYSLATKESLCTSNNSKGSTLRCSKSRFPLLSISLPASVLWHGWHAWPFLEHSLNHLACPFLKTFSLFTFRLSQILGSLPSGLHLKGWLARCEPWPIHKGYLEVEPIFPSGSGPSVPLDLEEETGGLSLGSISGIFGTSLSLLLLVALRAVTFLMAFLIGNKEIMHRKQPSELVN